MDRVRGTEPGPLRRSRQLPGPFFRQGLRNALVGLQRDAPEVPGTGGADLRDGEGDGGHRPSGVGAGTGGGGAGHSGLDISKRRDRHPAR